MQTHPTTSVQVPSASCGLATASLACGICGFILGPFTGIPAIITGHMALGRIKKSGAVLQGRGIAIAGLTLGYIFTALFVIVIPILAAAGFIAGNAAIQKARNITARASAMSIESAVNNFYTEYGLMPTTLTTDTEINTKDNITDFLNVLLGLESTTGTPLNTRAIKFLSVREGKANKNGLIYNSAGAVTGLYDPWGEPYKIMLDADNDEKLEVNGEALVNRRVVVWSVGPDRKTGTKDDIKTW